MTFLRFLFSFLHQIKQFPFFAARCAICGKPISNQEDTICTRCLTSLPYTNLRGEDSNRIEKYFWGHLPIDKASTLIIYHRGTKSHNLLRNLKYNKQPAIGLYFGRIIARQLTDSNFFEDIDAIIPVPLAQKRLLKRGYNQAEWIAKGIAKITNIPVITHAVKRNVANKTQTRLSRTERMNNVEGIFYVTHPENFDNRHILLIDDVITTGATLIACGKAFSKTKNLTISILTLAMASSICEVPYYKEDDNYTVPPDTEDVILKNN